MYSKYCFSECMASWGGGGGSPHLGKHENWKKTGIILFKMWHLNNKAWIFFSLVSFLSFFWIYILAMIDSKHTHTHLHAFIFNSVLNYRHITFQSLLFRHTTCLLVTIQQYWPVITYKIYLYYLKSIFNIHISRKYWSEGSKMNGNSVGDVIVASNSDDFQTGCCVELLLLPRIRNAIQRRFAGRVLFLEQRCCDSSETPLVNTRHLNPASSVDTLIFDWLQYLTFGSYWRTELSVKQTWRSFGWKRRNVHRAADVKLATTWVDNLWHFFCVSLFLLTHFCRKVVRTGIFFARNFPKEQGLLQVR